MAILTGGLKIALLSRGLKIAPLTGGLKIAPLTGGFQILRPNLYLKWKGSIQRSRYIIYYKSAPCRYFMQNLNHFHLHVSEH